MRLLIQIMLMPLPWAVRRWVLMKVFGFNIAPSARIRWSIILSRHLTMGEGARIGSLTYVKGLTELRLGDNAVLGNLNWVTGMPEGHPVFFAQDLERRPALIIGDHAAITHRHLLDCTDTVEIGSFCTFAGWGSQILTHAIDLFGNRQSAAPVRIGEYSFVGTRCVVLKGAELPPCSVLAAGSVLSTKEVLPNMLYSGVRAQAVKKIPPDYAYFKRHKGAVS